MTPSNPYLPPDADPQQPAPSEPVVPAPSSNAPADAHAPDASAATPPAGASSASGYVPPTTAATPPSASEPATTPQAARPGGAASSGSSGYVPPSVGPAAPATPTSTPDPAPQAEARASEPVDRTETTGRFPPVRPVETVSQRKLLPLVLAGVVGIAVLALVISALLGLFAPKMSRLPAQVAGYARESKAQQGTSTTYDNATYRAGQGDVLRASIKKDAPDPAIAFNKASAATRLQVGDVYCTGVTKSGKGADCAVKLPTGSAVVVSGSTRHKADEIAAFTAQVVQAMK